MDEPIACLAVMPGVSDRVRRYALEATRRSTARGMAGYAATVDDKIRLTANALTLFSRSRSEPTAPDLPGAISGATDELGAFDSWQDTSHFWNAGTWYDSQTVRSNLQAAGENVSIATGQTSPTWRPQDQPIVPVDANVEAAKVLPEEISKSAACLAKGMRMDSTTGECVPIISPDNIKKIALAVVFSLLAIGAGYVAIKSWAYGRGVRQNRPSGRGRRQPPRRRSRPGTVQRRYHVARRAA